MEQDREDEGTQIVGTRSERRTHKRRGRSAGESDASRIARSNTRALAMLVVGLALLVFLLGGFILVLKLKPVSVPASQVNARLVMWEQEVKRNGDDSWNWTGLGLAYQDANRQTDALEAFEKALDLDENNWLANFRAGLLYREDDGEKALKLLTRASQLAPPESSVPVFIALGDQLYAAGNYKKARQAYAKGVAILPGVFEGRIGLGRSLQALGENDLALEQYRKALQLNPGSAEAREAIANYRDDMAPITAPSPEPVEQGAST